MSETFIIWTIIVISVFFTGRTFYRQWKSATNNDATGSCAGGCCSSCSASSSCSSPNQDNKQI